MFRTGDRARRASDGLIEFVGRCDRQIKISGVRFELDEIEVVLSRLSEIRQAVAVPAAARRGPAFCVFAIPRHERVEAADLRRRLAEWLPREIRPLRVILTSALPFTSSGKIDRAALERRAAAAIAEDKTDPPTSLEEEILAEIWADLLKLRTVGVYSDFFELGGDSLLAVAMVSRIAETLGRELPLRMVFEFPTVAEIAGKLSTLSTTMAISTELGSLEKAQTQEGWEVVEL